MPSTSSDADAVKSSAGGLSRSSARIRGSAASTIEPARGRSYFGGPSLATAARTVFLDTPITRAISLIGRPSAR